MIDVDGATLEVLFGGTGEPVICESHPFGARASDQPNGAYTPWWWDPALGRLVGVNPRGVGQSSAGRGPQDWTFRQHVEDLETIRRSLGVERWVFMGGSGGGVLALFYALTHPTSLSGLVIEYMGPSARQIVEDPRSQTSPSHPQFQHDVARLIAETDRERRPAELRSVHPQLTKAEWVQLSEDNWVLVQEERPVVISGSEPRMWASYEDWVTTFDVRDRLSEIRLPTLVVAGRQDSIVPFTCVEQLQRGIPQAELVVLEETGHGDVTPDSADGRLFVGALRRFLDRLPATTPAGG